MGCSRFDKSLGELNEAVDIGEVRHQSGRDSHHTGALSIDTQAEIVEREVGILAKAGRQLGLRKLERGLPCPRIAEAAGAQRDPFLSRFGLDEKVIDDLSVGMVEGSW